MHPSSTNVLHNHPRIRLLCTNRSQSSWLSDQTVSSLNLKSANELNGDYLQYGECTPVHCLRPFFRSLSICSVVIHLFFHLSAVIANLVR